MRVGGAFRWSAPQALALLGIAFVIGVGCGGGGTDGAPAGTPTGEILSVTSTEIAEGGALGQTHAYDQFGCTGDNDLPKWSWSWSPGPSANLQSYALTCLDTTVPWVHFVSYNLIPATTGVGDLLPPGAVVGPNTYGGVGYGGPCPPSGQTHTYVYRAWALSVADLSTTPGFDANDPDSIVAAIQAHAIASAGISTTYARP